MHRLALIAASVSLAACMSDGNIEPAATNTVQPAATSTMQLSFTWGSIPRCTSGNPNIVANPNFTLTGVPAGTESVRFTMKDLNVPSYNHGGGTVAVHGDTQIAPGAFKYKSPCPPSGSHNYQWRAVAMGPNGVLGTASATGRYPN